MKRTCVKSRSFVLTFTFRFISVGDDMFPSPIPLNRSDQDGAGEVRNTVTNRHEMDGY